MKYDAEYTIKIRLSNISMRTKHTKREVEEKVSMLGRKSIQSFFEGTLDDPDKKIVCEEISFETKAEEI
jgi:hypothetical protein